MPPLPANSSARGKQNNDECGGQTSHNRSFSTAFCEFISSSCRSLDLGLLCNQAASTDYASQSAAHGIEFKTDAAISTDIAVDLAKTLDAEIHRLGADLVVMASHVAGFKDFIFSSNSGYLASHMDISVFIVR